MTERQCNLLDLATVYDGARCCIDIGWMGCGEGTDIVGSGWGKEMSVKRPTRNGSGRHRGGVDFGGHGVDEERTGSAEDWKFMRERGEWPGRGIAGCK